MLLLNLQIFKVISHYNERSILEVIFILKQQKDPEIRRHAVTLQALEYGLKNSGPYSSVAHLWLMKTMCMEMTWHPLTEH